MLDVDLLIYHGINVPAPTEGTYLLKKGEKIVFGHQLANE